jgi:predicted nucleic-acid-binding protein
MIGLDTNVLLRLLVHDDRRQLAAIERFLTACRNENYFVSDIVLVETVWTLRAAFRWEPAEVVAALRRLAAKPDVEFANRHSFTAAVNALQNGGDFADELIISSAREEDCSALATFDASLQKRHPEFTVAPE